DPRRTPWACTACAVQAHSDQPQLAHKELRSRRIERHRRVAPQPAAALAGHGQTGPRSDEPCRVRPQETAGERWRGEPAPPRGEAHMGNKGGTLGVRAVRWETQALSYVVVVDTEHRPLDPVHPGAARRLLARGQAAVWRRYPFTLLLKRALPEAAPHP